MINLEACWDSWLLLGDSDTSGDFEAVPIKPIAFVRGNTWDSKSHSLVEHLGVGSAMGVGCDKENRDIYSSLNFVVKTFGNG